MLLLPSHQTHGYEPLFASKQDAGLWRRLNEHKRSLMLLLVGLIAGGQILRMMLPQNFPFSTSSGGLDRQEQYLVPEEEWHVPVGVDLGPDNPLWKSQMEPFFREVPGYNHKEVGYGGDVNLNDAPFVRRSLYRHLLQSLATFSQQHDFHWWIAHGTLLGQRWGEKIMSVDTDVDVQCSLGALHRIKAHEEELWEERFKLVVNPHYLIRTTRNKSDKKEDMGVESNVIDARWIDVMTGFFIDITALSSLQSKEPLSDVAPFEGDKRASTIEDKSPHILNVSHINPQYRCRFEDMDVWCPREPEILLENEYPAYDDPHFEIWRFNEKIHTFQELKCPDLVAMYRSPTRENCDRKCQHVVAHQRTLEYSQQGIDCLLQVSWHEEAGGETIRREYRGREQLPGPKFDFGPERTVTREPVYLANA